MPVDLVPAEESQVDAAVARGGGGLAHRGRPVLVVAQGEHGAGAVEQVRVGVQVDVGGVAQRDAGVLSDPDGGQLELQELAGPGHRLLVGAVERHRPRARLPAPVRTLVEAVAAPLVVGLPGGHGVDHDQPAGVGRGPHRQRDVLLGTGVGVQAQQVVARRPPRGVDGRRRRPRRDHGVGRLLHHRRRLLRAGLRWRGPHGQGVRALVGADAERGHRVVRGSGGHEQPHRLAGRHAHPVGEALDRVLRTRPGQLPARCPGRRGACPAPSPEPSSGPWAPARSADSVHAHSVRSSPRAVSPAQSLVARMPPSCPPHLARRSWPRCRSDACGAHDTARSGRRGRFRPVSPPRRRLRRGSRRWSPGGATPSTRATRRPR